MILMDTCAILWDALGDSQLTAKASQAIQEADDRNALIISDISIWEIAMLVKKGRVELQTTAADFVNLFLQSRNVSVVQITPDVADLSVNFGPEISGDPRTESLRRHRSSTTPALLRLTKI